MGALAAVLLVTSTAGAASPTETLRGLFAEANQILAGAEIARNPEERLDAVLRVASEVIDAREAAALSLGREWTRLASTDRKEFAGLFAALLERAVILRVAAKADLEGGVRVRYLGEAIEGDRAIVETMLAGRQGGEIPVEYRMVRRGEGWAIRDVAIDGVSIVVNYRHQFQRIIERTSYQELVTQMREKVPEPPVTVPSGIASNRVEVPERPTSAAPVSPAGEPAGGGRSAPPPQTEPPRPVGLAESGGASRAATYWVQVGAFKNAGGVSRLMRGLQHESPAIVTAPLPRFDGQPIFRVLVGPFPDREHAASKLRELVRNGYQAFIAIEPD